MPNSSSIFQRINLAWDDIEQLMAKLDPSQLEVLSPPATQIQIDALSRSVGLNLPPEIQASLLRHNGCQNEGVFLRYHFYSTDNIAKKTLTARKAPPNVGERKSWRVITICRGRMGQHVNHDRHILRRVRACYRHARLRN